MKKNNSNRHKIWRNFKKADIGWMKKRSANASADSRRRVQKSFYYFLQKQLGNCKRTDNEKLLSNDLDLEFLLQLLEVQNQRCAISGVQLTHNIMDLQAVSIDRIDSSKGHTKDNVQLTAQIMNLGKCNKSNDAARLFVREIEMNVLKKLKQKNLLVS